MSYLVRVNLSTLAQRLARAFREECDEFNAASWLALKHGADVRQGRNIDTFIFKQDPALLLDHGEIASVASA